MKKKDIKILVATHKKYQMPSDDIYMPIQVGAEGKPNLGYLQDNTNDNISIKNPNYCELTALYWAWKNLNCDYIGLNHYRRYFTLKSKKEIKKCKNKYELILNRKEIEVLLNQYDIIVSQYINLYTKNIESKYKQQHYISDLKVTESVIEKLYPEYLECYKQTMKKHKMFSCNMFIMPKKLFNEYCEWLFNILFEVEKQTNIKNYSVLQKRIYGFLSERLMNVWVNYHNNLKVGNVQILSLEKDSLKTILKKSYKRIIHQKS